MAPKVKRLRLLSAKIGGWYQDADPEQSYRVEGKLFSVDLSPCTNKRVLRDLPRLFTHLGKTKFLEACSFSLDAFDRLVDPLLAGSFLTESRTGPRRIEAVVNVVGIAKGKKAA